MNRPVITLLTDFGHRDTYVGQMKGVIAHICPAANVIDLTHDVPPQNIAYGGYFLADALDAFPTHTIHIAVIDPGVGSKRKAIAIQTSDAIFIGPDNGLFTAALQNKRIIKIVELSQPDYWFGSSSTFHGRDIFAATAAHLAAGIHLSALGDPLQQYITLDLPQPTTHNSTLTGHVIMIDRFGNLITNIHRNMLEQYILAHGDRIALTCGHVQIISGIQSTFSDVSEGELVAYIGSSMRLEIGLRNGSAAQELDLICGSIATITKL
ncbi:SAM hydrolase/SAM-dependent halogenase family protein [Poriferisphaera sp. WC338]|uniref:SAM hydrolase/SAM-dependent halogenase family protein n=1 Tax=Poriferisphaera sp. WC338 TaxID=3425129 RepID=UPI003D81A93E